MEKKLKCDGLKDLKFVQEKITASTPISKSKFKRKENRSAKFRLTVH